MRLLPNESSIFEPLISAGAFGCLGMLHVYQLIPSVCGLFGCVRMLCTEYLEFEPLIFASAFIAF
jgi:hypothetical protein